jgi:hypothetical protein
MFAKLDLFPSSDEGETTILLDPLQRATPSHVVLYTGQWTKSKPPVIRVLYTIIKTLYNLLTLLLYAR